MKQRMIILVFGIAMMAASGWSQTTTGSIAGVLLDNQGKAYEGARVSATLMADQPERYTPWQGYAVTGKDGAYDIPGAPVGRHEICIWAPVGDWVNICLWGKAAAIATVAAGGKTTSNLALTPGKEVRLRLDDPEGYLERHDGKTVGAIVDVGIYTDNRMILTAEPAGQQKKGAKSYRILVPADAKWRVRAGSPFFRLETPNESQQPLSVLQELDQQVKSAEKDKEIVVTVKGLKAQEGAQ